MSPQGLAILQALAASRPHRDRRWYGVTYAAGQLPTTALVTALRLPGVSLGVLRASLSRTLRRLWRAGLVELLGHSWFGSNSMTEQALANRKKLAEVEKNPVAAYEQHLAWLASYQMSDGYGSPQAYLERERTRLGRTPDVRVTIVQITKAGRSAVNLVARRTVNRPPKQPTKLRRAGQSSGRRRVVPTSGRRRHHA